MADYVTKRHEYLEALSESCDSNLTDEDESRVLDELAQFLIDAMDHFEQTLVAEPAIVAAHKALVTMRTEREALYGRDR